MNVTLDEMRVVGLVRRKYGRHLVVVRRVDVLVDAVPGQLYLWRRALVSTTLRAVGRPHMNYNRFTAFCREKPHKGL